MSRGEKAAEILKQKDGRRISQGKGNIPNHLMMMIRVMFCLTLTAQAFTAYNCTNQNEQ
jgi:hypothetical protein